MYVTYAIHSYLLSYPIFYYAYIYILYIICSYSILSGTDKISITSAKGSKCILVGNRRYTLAERVIYHAKDGVNIFLFYLNIPTEMFLL